MRALSEIRESPNYERLKNSVEVRSCGRDCLIFGIITAVYSLIVTLPVKRYGGSGDTAVLWMLYLLVILPFFLYMIYKLVEVFLYINYYTFTEVVLDRPRQGYKGAMYFTVILRDRQGRELEADTRQIFSRGNPNFEDYVNQRALIGYNDKTERVVVVKKLP